LESFLAGVIDAHEIEVWAEAVQGRDDIGMREPDSELLGEALFELSTPELFGTANTTVPALLERLRDA
jgi:hypothetical protein